MARVLRLQISVFVDKKIEVTAENISKIMGQLKQTSGIDFLPSVVNTQGINTLTGNIENIQDLSFFDKENNNQLLLSTNRIDYSLNQLEGNYETDNLEIGINVLKLIMRNGNLRGNRLALNVDYLSDTHENTNGFLGKDVTSILFYKDKEIKEWSSRINAGYEIELMDEKEILNVITDFTHECNMQNGKSYIRCHSDINTLAENSDMRFSDESISAFVQSTIGIFESIKNDIDERVR